MNVLEPGFRIRLGGLVLSQSLLLSMLLAALLVALALWLRRRLAGGVPRWAEALYDLLRESVADVVPAAQVTRVLPFVGTLWVFIVGLNLLGLVPGLSSPTDDLSVTAALAVIVFGAVHVYGVRAAGWKAYLRHYLAPSPILLPFTVISEITRTLALAIRLFGNMMSLDMAALLVLLVAGLLVPVPLLLLHVVEALVQAYIFGMLALIYIGSALEVGAGRTGPGPSPAAPEAP